MFIVGLGGEAVRRTFQSSLKINPYLNIYKLLKNILYSIYLQDVPG